jgi:hypothetical protein
MADWVTISSLATAGGTLVLAIATFGATRSANRSTRIAEEALLAGIRPLLLSSRPQDPPEKIGWMDEHWTKINGGEGALEFDEDGDNIYIAAALRNVGTGIAIMHGWYVWTDFEVLLTNPDPADPADFRRQGRDLYIAPGDTGFWQGAIRDTDDSLFPSMQQVCKSKSRFAVDIMYGDQEGGQRTITRFGFQAFDDARWLCTTSRHWFLDRDDPR